MKKYLFIILLVGVCFGQEEKGKADKKEISKVRCRECFLPMKETINAYVCRDNHMSVKKSDVKIDKSGKLYVVKDGELEAEYEGGIKFGAVLVAASGALGLYMNNLEFDSVDEWYDYIESDAKALNNARFGLLLIGGILLLFD